MHCYRCQAELPADATFCSGCGARTTAAPRTIRIAPTTRAVTGPTQRLRLDPTSRLSSDTSSPSRPPRPPIARSRAGRLSAIEELHKQGLLTDQEFAIVKATLQGKPLSGASTSEKSEPGVRLTVTSSEQPGATGASTPEKSDIKELAETITAKQALKTLDQEWQAKREQYMNTRNSRIIAGVMVLTWTIIVLSMALQSMGILFISFALIAGILMAFIIISRAKKAGKATEYKQAHETYQKRRAELVAEIEKKGDQPVA